MLSKISDEELQKLPIETIDGEIVVVDNRTKAEIAMSILWQQELVGFDSETRPSFKKGVTNKVALIQLATEKQFFLFRMNMIGAYKPLYDFMESERVKKVGLAVASDYSALRRLRAFNPKGFIDVQALVKEIGIEDQSLLKIYAILFGKRISKKQRLSNWEAPVLSDLQQVYAALDALSCLHIYYKVKTILDGTK